jgi:hypothetical protein
MPVVSVGEFDMKFEDVVFSLKKNGEIAAPFETENGFHIIKRLQHIPIDKNYSEASRSLQQAVERDKRFNLARESFQKKAREITGMKKLMFNAADLFAYTDSFQKKHGSQNNFHNGRDCTAGISKRKNNHKKMA